MSHNNGSVPGASLRKCLHFLLATNQSLLAFILRLVLGVVMFQHACQRLFTWALSGEPALALQKSSERLHEPIPIVLMAVLIELTASICMALGLGTRLIALGFGFMMGLAIVFNHPQCFLPNWFGSATPQGYQYQLFAFGIAFALMVSGGGFCSMDRSLSNRMRARV